MTPQEIVTFQRYAAGKLERTVRNPCAGCLGSAYKVGAVASFADAQRPVVVNYVLCTGCAVHLEEEAARKRLIACVEENLEALGVFELSLNQGQA